MPKKKNKNNAGRLLFDGKTKDQVIAKLEEAWALGSSDAEAACNAGISPTALCRFLKVNPEISQRKEVLLEQPMLRARRTIVKNLDTDLEHAWRFAKKKRPEEFGDKALEVEDGESGFNLVITTIKNDKAKDIKEN